jgi:hypothetical protein
MRQKCWLVLNLHNIYDARSHEHQKVYCAFTYQVQRFGVNFFIDCDHLVMFLVVINLRNITFQVKESLPVLAQKQGQI